MNEEKFPAGTRVKNRNHGYLGTSQGYKRDYSGALYVVVAFDNGQTDTLEEVYLSNATEEDEEKNAEHLARDEATRRYRKEREEAGRILREENAKRREEREKEEAEAEEEARRQAKTDYTNEMRAKNSRAYGLESLLRR